MPEFIMSACHSTTRPPLISTTAQFFYALSFDLPKWEPCQPHGIVHGEHLSSCAIVAMKVTNLAETLEDNTRTPTACWLEYTKPPAKPICLADCGHGPI
mmetsp:Transcript_102368/g.176769  ORF Transcript_102368/g.176769 Transcript_102368/m.176769 type:complete len:99 (+) Transcript_102368:2209-2505(+)